MVQRTYRMLSELDEIAYLRERVSSLEAKCEDL